MVSLIVTSLVLTLTSHVTRRCCCKYPAVGDSTPLTYSLSYAILKLRPVFSNKQTCFSTPIHRIKAAHFNSVTACWSRGQGPDSIPACVDIISVFKQKVRNPSLDDSYTRTELYPSAGENSLCQESCVSVVTTGAFAACKNKSIDSCPHTNNSGSYLSRFLSR